MEKKTKLLFTDTDSLINAMKLKQKIYMIIYIIFKLFDFIDY